MLITLKKDGKEILQSIEDPRKTVTFIGSKGENTTMTTPCGEVYAFDELIIDATALNEENEELKQTVKEKNLNLIFSWIFAFVSIVFLTILALLK